MDQFPPELILQIFTCLPARTLVLSCIFVSKQWKELAIKVLNERKHAEHENFLFSKLQFSVGLKKYYATIDYLLEDFPSRPILITVDLFSFPIFFISTLNYA